MVSSTAYASRFRVTGLSCSPVQLPPPLSVKMYITKRLPVTTLSSLQHCLFIRSACWCCTTVIFVILLCVHGERDWTIEEGAVLCSSMWPVWKRIPCYFGVQKMRGIRDDLRICYWIGGELVFSQLFPTWSVSASTITGIRYGWSLNIDAGHKSIIFRQSCACTKIWLSANTMLKYSRRIRLHAMLYIRYCRLRGRTMSALTMCLSKLLHYLRISTRCISMVSLTMYCGSLACRSPSAPFCSLYSFYFMLLRSMCQIRSLDRCALIILVVVCCLGYHPLWFTFYATSGSSRLPSESGWILYMQPWCFMEQRWFISSRQKVRLTLLHRVSPRERWVAIRVKALLK